MLHNTILYHIVFFHYLKNSIPSGSLQLEAEAWAERSSAESPFCIYVQISGSGDPIVLAVIEHRSLCQPNDGLKISDVFPLLPDV